MFMWNFCKKGCHHLTPYLRSHPFIPPLPSFLPFLMHYLFLEISSSLPLPRYLSPSLIWIKPYMLPLPTTTLYPFPTVTITSRLSPSCRWPPFVRYEKVASKSNPCRSHQTPNDNQNSSKLKIPLDKRKAGSGQQGVNVWLFSCEQQISVHKRSLVYFSQGVLDTWARATWRATHTF